MNPKLSKPAVVSVITLNRRSYSIRRRILTLLLASVGGLVIIANLILGSVVSHRLQAEYDTSLLAKARALVTLTEHEPEGVELEFADEFMPEFEATENPEYFQLWLDDGTVLERSHSLGYREDGMPLPGADALRYRDLPQLAPRSEQPRFRDLSLPDGRSGRLVQIDFQPQIDDDDRALLKDAPRHFVTLVMARERERLDYLLNGLSIALVAISAVLLMIIVIIVRFVVSSGLRPLQDIREQVERLDVDSLHTRLAMRHPTVELDTIVKQFNGLLERLEAAFRRERQFTADVSHELRTPLAELRNLCEVALRWPEDKQMVEEFFREMLEATLQMERIVSNLLALARCDEGLEMVENDELDLVELVDRAWQRVLPEAQQKHLALRRHSPATLTICIGRDQLELILNNLFSNAVAYSSPHSQVICTVAKNERAWTLTIANRAEHLEANDLPVMFDRLWRKDPARTGGHHAGLGLALVKAYAAQVKLTVQVALEPDQIFRITLSGVVKSDEAICAIKALVDH